MDFFFRAEFVHVWRGGDIIPKGPTHSAQMVLDGISFVKDTVYSYTQQPTKAISNWATDQVAPTYWKPNHKIIVSKFNLNLLFLKTKLLFLFIEQQ